MWGMGTVVRAQGSSTEEGYPSIDVSYLFIYKGNEVMDYLKSKVKFLSTPSAGSVMVVRFPFIFIIHLQSLSISLERWIQRKAEEKINRQKQKQKRLSSNQNTN